MQWLIVAAVWAAIAAFFWWARGAGLTIASNALVILVTGGLGAALLLSATGNERLIGLGLVAYAGYGIYTNYKIVRGVQAKRESARLAAAQLDNPPVKSAIVLAEDPPTDLAVDNSDCLDNGTVVTLRGIASIHMAEFLSTALASAAESTFVVDFERSDVPSEHIGNQITQAIEIALEKGGVDRVFGHQATQFFIKAAEELATSRGWSFEVTKTCFVVDSSSTEYRGGLLATHTAPAPTKRKQGNGLDLEAAIPRFELVTGGSRRCSTIAGARLHPSGQPELTDERELARLGGVITSWVRFQEDGDPRAVGASFVKEASSDDMAGVVVFTETRAVGAIVLGDFFGSKVNFSRHQQAVMFEFPYEQVAELQLLTNHHRFGGDEDFGFMLLARNPYISAISLDVRAEVSLDAPDLPIGRLLRRHFDRIAAAIANRSLDLVAPAEQEIVRRFLEQGASSNEDGRVAVFESD